MRIEKEDEISPLLFFKVVFKSTSTKLKEAGDAILSFSFSYFHLGFGKWFI
jgi:hypothetical protein